MSKNRMWLIDVHDRHRFCVRRFPGPAYLVWFTGTDDGDVVLDRGGLKVMRDLLDMVLLDGEEQ